MYVARQTNLIFLNQDKLISGNRGTSLTGNHGFKSQLLPATQGLD